MDPVILAVILMIGLIIAMGGISIYLLTLMNPTQSAQSEQPIPSFTEIPKPVFMPPPVFSVPPQPKQQPMQPMQSKPQPMQPRQPKPSLQLQPLQPMQPIQPKPKIACNRKICLPVKHNCCRKDNAKFKCSYSELSSC